jgi:hypothetical protein
VNFADNSVSSSQSPFLEFASNPPIHGGDSHSSHRVRLSSDEIEAIVAAHRSLLDEDRQTHILIRRPTSDSEIDAVLNALAGESSESAQLGSGSGALKQSGAAETKADYLASPRRKRPCQPDAPADVPGLKQKRRRLRRLVDMQQVPAQAEPVIGDDMVDADLVDDVGGGVVAKTFRYVVDEAEENEDEECKENGPRAFWLTEFWCLMNNTISELISFLVFVFVVYRMRRELDQGNEDATPQKKT